MVKIFLNYSLKRIHHGVTSSTRVG